MRIQALVERIATCVFAWRGAGGTKSARYCYSVWLRHIAMAYRSGLPVQPHTVAELGPGGSLGTGLAALLSGADTYYALDVVEYANRKRDAEILHELMSLFEKREPIPDETEFPEVRPHLESYEFPHHILPNERLGAALGEDRVEHIRCALLDSQSGLEDKIRISYLVPWYDSASRIEEESVDMVFSQAVLEHVDELASTYQEVYRWLKPGGFMSHEIDFRCHGTARKWNGHWAHSDSLWRLIRGVWPYLLNRQPRSKHIELLQELGLEIVCDIKVEAPPGIQRKQLASRFKDLSDEDLTTSGAFIQAMKKRTQVERNTAWSRPPAADGAG